VLTRQVCTNRLDISRYSTYAIRASCRKHSRSDSDSNSTRKCKNQLPTCDMLMTASTIRPAQHLSDKPTPAIPTGIPGFGTPIRRYFHCFGAENHRRSKQKAILELSRDGRFRGHGLARLPYELVKSRLPLLSIASRYILLNSCSNSWSHC
jgi:hypothetical protein